MKIFFAVLVAIIGILLAPMLLSPAPNSPRGQAITGLPWQIDIQPDGGSKVFDLVLATSTLADARGRFGAGEIALVAAPGEAESLELYFDSVTLGGAITGKMIVTADLSAEVVAAMRRRAPKTEYMNSSTRKSSLADTDLPTAWAAPIRGLAFVPSINLDEALVLQRFGQPKERIKAGATYEHFLYPDRGLDIRLDTEGKEVLQYVAPRDFALLREPLNVKGQQ